MAVFPQFYSGIEGNKLDSGSQDVEPCLVVFPQFHSGIERTKFVSGSEAIGAVFYGYMVNGKRVVVSSLVCDSEI